MRSFHFSHVLLFLFHAASTSQLCISSALPRPTACLSGDAPIAGTLRSLHNRRANAGATPMFGSVATTATASSAAKSDAPRPMLGSRLLAAFGNNAGGHPPAPPHDTPNATSAGAAVGKRGPTLTSIALASIALDGGPPSPPSGPTSASKSPRVPPPATSMSPRPNGTAESNLPASKSGLSVPGHLAQLPPDSPQRVAHDILAAQDLARNGSSRSAAAAAAAGISTQPSAASIPAEHSTASDMFLSADASILRLPLPPSNGAGGGSTSRRSSTGQPNPPSNPPSHRRSQSAEEFAAAAAYLHPLSQTQTQGTDSLNTTPRLPAPTPRTEANLKHGPRSARPAVSSRPMHADDPSPDGVLTRMQSAAAALQIEKSTVGRTGSTLHNEPSAASTGT